MGVSRAKDTSSSVKTCRLLQDLPVRASAKLLKKKREKNTTDEDIILRVNAYEILVLAERRNQPFQKPLKLVETFRPARFQKLASETVGIMSRIWILLG